MRKFLLALFFAPIVATAANYADVLNGVVTNVIVWDGVSPYTPPDGGTLVLAGPNAQVGATYANGVFTAPPPPAPVVPASVTAVQMRLALAQLNMLTQITAAVNASSQVTQVYWNYQTVYFRNNSLLESLATSPPISLTDTQIDQIFILAATFQP